MSSPQMNSRQKQALDTKKRIYDASVKLMEQKGFYDMKISEICEIAGVSVGSFYHYFSSKSDILVEIFKRADDYFKDVVENDLNKENIEENIAIFFGHYGKYNEMIGLETVKQLYNPNNMMFTTKGRYMQKVLINIISKSQEKGELANDMTAEEMTEYLFVAARGVIFDWCIRNGCYDLKEYIREYFFRFIKIFVKK